MSYLSLLITLCLPAILTLAAMAYLRPILREVLGEICGTAERGEFWIRSATLLSLFGALLLVLAFAYGGPHADPVENLRWILFWTLAGGFVGVSWIARTIWQSLMNCPETRARLYGLNQGGSSGINPLGAGVSGGGAGGGGASARTTGGSAGGMYPYGTESMAKR
jgi:uncharacterized membrane protein YgcG